MLLIIGYFSVVSPFVLKASDSKFDSSELVESSITLGYGVLDLFPTVALRYGTFWLAIITILIDFNGY